MAQDLAVPPFPPRWLLLLTHIQTSSTETGPGSRKIHQDTKVAFTAILRGLRLSISKRLNFNRLPEHANAGHRP